VPPVVLEVVFGYIAGPQCLGLIRLQGPVDVLYLLGLGFLLFLAGQDVEPARFRGPTFRLAGLAFLASLALSFPVAAALRGIAPGADLRLLALALTASSLGVLIPVLRDAGEITGEFGQMVVMAGSVGEFGALLLLTILFSAQPESTPVQVLYVVAMGASAVVVAFVLTRLWRSGWLGRILLVSDGTTSQLRVRGAFVMLMIFTGLAHQFGVDALLGAFIAGVVLSVSDGDDRPNQEHYWAKLQAIGFGFLVPVFFVGTGVQLDLRSLVKHGSSLALVPLLVVAIAIVRGGPALVYRRRIGTRAAVAAGFLQATTLTFPVVIASFGLDLHLMDRSTAAALVGAALVSVLVFPAAALAMRPWTVRPPGGAAPSGATPTGAAPSGAAPSGAAPSGATESGASIPPLTGTEPTRRAVSRTDPAAGTGSRGEAGPAPPPSTDEDGGGGPFPI
jgi:Kef-type K+ transport system membrane component KefB